MEPLCVYAGENKTIIDTVSAESVQLARYQPQLNRSNLPASVCHSIGCFLKLELALVPELVNEDSVLYCDLDVLFRKSLDPLFAQSLPPYMAMAREYTAPFYHKYPTLNYVWRGHEYTVRMPFPIWTFSSGVVVFNLARLRQHDLIHHFLAFSQENAGRIENLDQSLLNYYFGKKITRLADCWNRPPYQADSLETGAIVHFHGPKPWDTTSPSLAYLRINQFDAMRKIWFSYLTEPEKEELKTTLAS